MDEPAGETGLQADERTHGRVDNGILLDPVTPTEYIRLLEDRLFKLESKFYDLEAVVRSDRGPAQSDETTTDSEIDSVSSVQRDKQSEESPNPPQSAKPIIPSLSKVSWFGFRNLLEGDDVFAIDVCSVKTAGCYNDDASSRKFRHKGASLNYKQGVQMFLNFKVPPRGADVVNSIRINSMAILTLLHDIDPRVPIDGSPLRLDPPFLSLIHYHDQVKQILDRTRSAVKTSDTDTERHRAEELLRHMDPYMHFMDTEVLPKYRRLGLQEVNTVNAKVRFSELPYLFRRDDDIYQPASTDALSEDSLGHQEAWRILPERISSFYQNNTEKFCCFDVICYHIAFDGRSYVPIRKCLTIVEFEGERDVTSLPMYPLRFMPNHREIRTELRNRGARFLEYINSKQVSYQGWALQHLDGHGNDRTYISSNLVVDFAETSRAHPDWADYVRKSDWKNDFEENPFASPEDGQSTLWELSRTTNKLEVKTCKTESVYDLSLPHEQTDTCLQKHRFILEFNKRQEEPTAIGQLQGELEIQEDELVLLPKRLFAYALQDRKFVMLDIASARSIAQTGDPFKELIISRSHKDMISSLVHAHFEKKQMEQIHGFYHISQDIIHNKGRGLVILLHGVPGVGKSSTAEAVAQRWKRPLLAITCGDVGLEAADVEHSLKEVFRLAQLWDCVLLLDEADVFLSQRSVSDLQRNSLVSVFLRVLEYYSGILFLTTNRVGHIDEAFMSRIHISLYYPRLDLDQTIDIWRMNIDRLQSIEKKRSEATGKPALTIAADEILEYAKKHFHARGPDRAWNGRQIRNAFQTAAALARYEFDTSLNKTLENLHHVLARHFKTVARVGRGFEDYLRETRGKSDSDLAYDTKTRADHIIENRPQKPPIVSEAASGPGQSKYQSTYLNPNQDNHPSPNIRAGGYQTAPQNYILSSSGQYTPNAYSQGRASSPQQFYNAATNPFLSTMDAGNPRHTTPSRSMTPQPPMEPRGGNFSYECVQNPSLTLGQYHIPQDDDEFSD